jgi:hypothetical protein
MLFFYETPEQRVRTIARHLHQQIEADRKEKYLKFRSVLLEYKPRFEAQPNFNSKLVLSGPNPGLRYVDIAAPLKRYLEAEITPHYDNLESFLDVVYPLDVLFQNYVFKDTIIHKQDGIETSRRYVNSDGCYRNAKGKYTFYFELWDIANQINNYLMADNPDYNEIHRLANLLKELKRSAPTMSGRSTEDITISFFSGGNILTHFFWGLAQIAFNLFKLSVGLICAIPYYLTQYTGFSYGSLAGLTDSLTQMMNAFAVVIGSVVFPLGMLYSKQQTGSWNVVKGELSRTVDGLISSVENVMREPNFESSFEKQKIENSV